MRVPRLPALQQPIITIRTAVVAALVAVVVVTGLAVGVGVVASAVADSTAAHDNRDSLRARAGDVVSDVFTIRAASWQADRERARRLVTGSLAATVAAQLHRPPDDGVLETDWTVDSVAVTGADQSTGDTLIHAQVLTRRTGAPDDTQARTLTAHFQRMDGAWLLAGADVIE